MCIDPPFAKNDTFTGDKLKPALSKAEGANEKRLLKRWEITTPEQADAKGIAWPDDPKSRGGYKDQWSWEQDIHEDWVDGIKATHPAVNLLIEATREIHGDGIAAYLAFVAIRVFEIHRILKPTGSLYLHCDHTASGYLRQLLDGVFGADNFRNEVVWSYRTGGVSKRYWPRKHDTIYFYSKSGEYKHNPIQERLIYEKPFFTSETDEDGNYYADVYVRDVWDDVKPLINVSKERTGYPTQKPIALAERIIQASTNPGDVVLDCFAGCAYAAMAAEKLGRQWVACDINPRAWTVFKRQFNKGGDLPLLTCNDRTTGQQVLGSEPTVTVHGPEELPTLTTTADVEIKPLRTTAQREKAAPKYKRESTLMNRREMLEALLKFSEGKGWCCGFESRNANGTLDYGNYELDHIIPRSHGGEDDIVNRAPLCKTHNLLKSNLNMTLADLRVEVAMRGEMKVRGQAELVKLDLARLYAVEVRKEAYQRKVGKGMKGMGI